MAEAKYFNSDNCLFNLQQSGSNSTRLTRPKNHSPVHRLSGKKILYQSLHVAGIFSGERETDTENPDQTNPLHL